MPLERDVKHHPVPTTKNAFPIPVEGSDFLLEETNTILSYLDDSLPELETFSFDIEEKNSGITTTHADISLLELK
ncbi:hypothetical protein Tco_1038606 [Tanacetum coccineum]